jgi:predicted ThiF/HesA family dinucleotide-utilizing enzyme
MMQSRRNLVIATSDLVAAALTTRTLADDDKTVDYVLVQTSKSLTVDISPITPFFADRPELAAKVFQE